MLPATILIKTFTLLMNEKIHTHLFWNTKLKNVRSVRMIKFAEIEEKREKFNKAKVLINIWEVLIIK